MRVRSWKIVVVLVSATVAACSSGSDSSSSTGDVVPVGSSATQATDPPTEDTADDLPEGRGVVTENADGTRTVTSSYGTALVPADPQRVVSVIGDIDFEAMLALGVVPVGAGT